MPNYTYQFTLDYPLDPTTARTVEGHLRNLEMTFNTLMRERQTQELHLRGVAEDRPIANGGPPGIPHAAASRRLPMISNPQVAKSYRCVETFGYHATPVHSIDVSPDNTRIATASWDATVSIYNLSSRVKESVLSSFQKGEMDEQRQQNIWEAGEMGGLYCVKFARSPSHHNILGCASADHMVYLWNFSPQSPGVTMRLKGHEDEVNCIDFHPVQAVVCSTSDDCEAIVWDMDSGVTLRTLEKHPQAVYGAAFLGQEQEYLVATVCFDQKTRVFDMRDKQIVAQLQGHTDDVIGIDYSNKSLLATGSDDGMIVIWDARTWKCVTKINTHDFAPDNEVKRVKFSKDVSGKLEIASGGSDNSVYIFDINLDSPVIAAPTHVLAGHTDCAFDCAWGVALNGNSFVVTASHDHTWKYWVAQ